MWLDKHENKTISPRDLFALWAIFALLAILFLRIWYLQIASGKDLYDKSQRNITQGDRKTAPRGIITDRQGKVIAKVNLQQVVYAVPNGIAKHPDTLSSLARILNTSVNELQELILHEQVGEYKPVPIVVNPTIEQLTKIMEYIQTLRDIPPEEQPIKVIEQPIREYLNGPIWAHVVGHVGPIRPDELQMEPDKYSQSDYIGRLGLEKTYESILRGTAGGDIYETNAKGRRIHLIDSQNPVPGGKITMTIDSALQVAAMNALSGNRGAVVALNPNNGEVLALASNPTFDPNVFVGKISTKTWKSLVGDPFNPMYNRAIGTALAPGSTFKIVTALAGLRTGVITPYTPMYCPGFLQVGNRKFKCHHTHQDVNFNRAIADSCDVFFYQTAKRMDPDPAAGPIHLSSIAKEFGLGSKMNIDLPGEAKGIIPDAAWKRERFKFDKRWQLGDTINMSIGQGFVTATPLQMACIAMMTANKGIIYRPHVLKSVTYPDGTVSPYKPIVEHQVALDNVYWNAIIKGMVDATLSGTARSIALPNIIVASKTGSAEGRKGSKTHAWYIGFAPADNPQIAICVMLEQAGHGGDKAAPIAKKVLSEYFKIR